MHTIPLWGGVLGALVGLWFSARLFLNGFLNWIGGYDFGPQTMLWTAFLCVLYLAVAAGCILALVLTSWRRGL